MLPSDENDRVLNLLIPMGELRKRFAMIPEETIWHTLQNTTQYYSEIEDENRGIP